MAEAEQTEQNEAQGERNGDGSSRLSRVLNKDVLIPAAATAATAAAAGLAVKKGPDIKNKLKGEARESAQELGGAGVEGAKDALTGGGGGGVGGVLSTVAGGASKLLPGGKGKGGKKKTRRLPIQRWTDVAVPVERAYEQWTKFEDFPKFMHRVLSVRQEDDDKVSWDEKIWFSKRHWEGEITDRRENDRIAWKTTTGTSHSGVVSFHRLDDNLTRIMVTMDFQPTGMIEKMASGLRFVKRAVQADLARFKAHVEMQDVEGLEYESQPGKQEKEDDGDEQDDGDRNGDRSSARGSAGDDADSSDDDGASSRRRGRETRRDKRETAGSR